MARTTQRKIHKQEQAQIATVLERFGLVPVDILPVIGSRHCFHVKALGKQAQAGEFFLKESSSSINAVAQKKLFEELKRYGFPDMPELHLSTDGSPEITDDGSFFTLWHYYNCDLRYQWLQFNCTPPHCFLAGQTLSRLHGSGQKLIGKNPEFPIRSLSEKLETLPAELEFNLLRYGSDAQNRNNHKCPISLVLPVSEVVLNRSRQICARVLEIEKNSTATINHGDFHPGNLIFLSNKIEAVADWDFAVKGNGTYDLCYALFMFCLNGKEDSPELFSRGKTEAFLDGYSRASVTVKNMEYLNSYTELVHLIMLNWLIDEICNPASVYVEEPGFSRLMRALSACLG